MRSGWTDPLGVDAQTLRSAAAAVGNSAEIMCKHLGEK